MRPAIVTALVLAEVLVRAQDQPHVFPSKPGITVITRPKADGDTMVWSSPTRLTWADYQGVVPSPRPGAAASTLRLLAQPEMGRDGQVIWYIHPTFSRSRSWVIANPKDPDRLLAHERSHFDLAEVYARLVRNYLVENPPKTYSSDEGRMMNSRITALRAELDSEGMRYDVETKHGMDAAEQARWAAHIAERLNELEAWRWGACGLLER